jgi:hypothetical protein
MIKAKTKRSHARKRKPRRRPAPVPVPVLVNDSQILTVQQWCSLNALGYRTGIRILASGDGPTITQLSAGRIGISVRANRARQESRARAS